MITLRAAWLMGLCGGAGKLCSDTTSMRAERDCFPASGRIEDWTSPILFIAAAVCFDCTPGTSAAGASGSFRAATVLSACRS